MKRYLKTDEWNIIEDNFHADNLRMSESIFSLGNGRFGQRGNFEEPYSSDSYRGSFVAGITFLDKTRVGWWKNGFPHFYTRIPNAADWSRVSLRLIDEELDLAQWDVNSFSRRLDMKAGISYRDFGYTNYSCVQCLRMTLNYLEIIAGEYPDEYARVRRVTNLRQQEEAERWRDIINRMYLPEDKELGIFVQNDGFLDKELNSTDAIPPEERPINQHWSWDRILRSCYIKQSDVLLGLYLYYFNFDKETVRRNFDFYETMTVHESSLSPHIHSILAARIGEVEKAYQLFLHATRLDLDDYNNETHQGLHITSMPGSWLAIVRGFAGMQILEGILSFFPVIPEKWNSYSFQINYQGRTLHMHVSKEINISLIAGEELNIQVYKNVYKLKLGTDLLLRIEE